MRPILHKFKLSDLPQRQANKICKCDKKCEFGVTMTTNNDGLLLCWNDARRHMFDLIRLLDEGGAYTTWSKSDEQYIIDLVKRRGGMVKGINREIAEALGKTYDQAKSKTKRMKKAGLI